MSLTEIPSKSHGKSGNKKKKGELRRGTLGFVLLSFQELILFRAVVLSWTGRIRLWSQAAPAVSKQCVWSLLQGKRESLLRDARESLFRDAGCHMNQAPESEIFLFSETPNHFLLKLKERCSPQSSQGPVCQRPLQAQHSPTSRTW